ncbi:MAG: hypothetical protein H6R07_2797 [Proteobacteria bacterium]|nr:hypothetical protein [Pseudomonadota bacterium]
MALLRTFCLSAALILSLSGCEQVNDQLNKQKLVGKAVGAGCRQSGRSLEDCYNRNSKVAKPDIFAGWKEMSEYMQAKKLDVIPPQDQPPTETAADKAEPKASEPAAASTASAVRPAKKTVAKAPAKH